MRAGKRLSLGPHSWGSKHFNAIILKLNFHPFRNPSIIYGHYSPRSVFVLFTLGKKLLFCLTSNFDSFIFFVFFCRRDKQILFQLLCFFEHPPRKIENAFERKNKFPPVSGQRGFSFCFLTRLCCCIVIIKLSRPQQK